MKPSLVQWQHWGFLKLFKKTWRQETDVSTQGDDEPVKIKRKSRLTTGEIHESPKHTLLKSCSILQITDHPLQHVLSQHSQFVNRLTLHKMEKGKTGWLSCGLLILDLRQTCLFTVDMDESAAACEAFTLDTSLCGFLCPALLLLLLGLSPKSLYLCCVNQYHMIWFVKLLYRTGGHVFSCIRAAGLHLVLLDAILCSVFVFGLIKCSGVSKAFKSIN